MRQIRVKKFGLLDLTSYEYSICKHYTNLLFPILFRKPANYIT